MPVYVTVSRCDEPGDPAADLLPSFTASYWTFHPFSEGKRAIGRLRGSHVGDWEHVSLMVQVRDYGKWKEIRRSWKEVCGGTCLTTK